MKAYEEASTERQWKKDSPSNALMGRGRLQISEKKKDTHTLGDLENRPGA